MIHGFYERGSLNEVNKLFIEMDENGCYLERVMIFINSVEFLEVTSLF